MELLVQHRSGKPTERTVLLAKEVFGITPNDHAMYLDVKQIMANRRQGTHKAKGKSDLSGSTRKIKRQKGTGGARAGSIKSPLFVGGARVFGPEPRDYGFKLNKKVKRLARRSSLSYKAQQGNVIVLEDFVLDKIATKSYVELLQHLGVGSAKTLLVLPAVDRTIVLSARNLAGANVVCAEHLNTYDVLNAQKVIFFERALEATVSYLVS